jgi:2',3'-cyclic-nucleotide 2'-phosphodiesterase (5'-nucleotidase family)
MNYTPTAQLVTPWITGRVYANGSAVIGPGQTSFTVIKNSGSGYYDIIFNSPYPNTYYAVNVTAQTNVGANTIIATWGNSTFGITQSRFGVRTVNLSGVLTDSSFSVMVF